MLGLLRGALGRRGLTARVVTLDGGLLGRLLGRHGLTARVVALSPGLVRCLLDLPQGVADLELLLRLHGERGP